MSQALEPEGGERMCARKVQTDKIFFEMALFPLGLIITLIGVEIVIMQLCDLCVCVLKFLLMQADCYTEKNDK